MNNLQEEAVDTVDGSDFSESEYELAIDNDIQVTNYSSDEPKGEVEVETIEEQDDDLEIVEDPAEPVKKVEAQETTTEEVDADPFGTPSEDTGVQGEEEEDDADWKDAPKGFKKRLKRESRKFGRLEREFEAFKAQHSTPTPTPKSENSAVYKREHFSSDGEYIEHVAQAKADESVQKILQKQQQDQQAHAKQKELAESWNEKVQANYSNEDDKAEYFDAIATLGNPQEVFSEDIVKYMFQHEHGPRMLRYFAERPQAVEQLNRTHAYDIPSMLNKVSQYVGRSSAPTETPKATKAPAPTGSLTNKTNGVTVKSTDNMSDEELLKAYDSGTLKF